MQHRTDREYCAWPRPLPPISSFALIFVFMEFIFVSRAPWSFQFILLDRLRRSATPTHAPSEIFLLLVPKYSRVFNQICNSEWFENFTPLNDSRINFSKQWAFRVGYLKSCSFIALFIKICFYFLLHSTVAVARLLAAENRMYFNSAMEPFRLKFLPDVFLVSRNEEEIKQGYDQQIEYCVF